MLLEVANGKHGMGPISTAVPAHPPPCTPQPTAETLCSRERHMTLNSEWAHGNNLKKLVTGDGSGGVPGSIPLT